MAKTKIELFEDSLMVEQLTDEKLGEYEILLRRVGNDWCRIQHCFSTAYALPVERIDDAVRLIEFGNERYGSKESYLIPANEKLGMIYERAGLYKKAYDVYARIYPNIGAWKGPFPWCLLDMKMHIDGFQYSKELDEYIELCEKEDMFAKSFEKNRFILSLAEFIVADYHHDSNKKQRYYAAICEMLAPGYKGPLYEILKKHKLDEQLRLTAECEEFLESIRC